MTSLPGPSYSRLWAWLFRRFRVPAPRDEIELNLAKADVLVSFAWVCAVLAIACSIVTIIRALS